jgi:sterol desaturase/sphingolipid hydroxylase (fatty acid hydroxylase superfamily)
VPIERFCALGKEQKILRQGFWTRLACFFSSHLVLEITTLLAMAPAAFFFRWALGSPWQRAIGAQQGWLQFLEILIISDLSEYWIHRLFHVVPFLWRFHAIHHSSPTMDWLAGSRLYLFDVVITRAFIFAPMYALGFAPAPLAIYLLFVAFHAVFVHANLRWRFGRLAWAFGTPRFHHWHHSAEVLDKNFALHLPAIDWLFGTLHLPGDGWPKTYGIEGHPVPEQFSKELIYPLK